MHWMPYPPEWSRSYSSEILTLWERYSRHCWLRVCLFFRDDDKQAAWRITAAAGYVAMLLVLLLFLQTASDTMQLSVAGKPSVEQPPEVLFEPPPEQTEAPVYVAPQAEPEPIATQYNPWSTPVHSPDPEPVVQPVSETVNPFAAPMPVEAKPDDSFVDPFDLFRKPEEPEKPAEPEANSPVFFPAPDPEPEPEPEPEPIFSQPVIPVTVKPELLLEGSTTGLVADPIYTEQLVTNQGEGWFGGLIPDRHLADIDWRTGTGFEVNPLDNPLLSGQDSDLLNWLSEVADPPVSSDRPLDPTATHRSVLEDDVLLTKRCATEIEPGQPLSYTLTVHNRGADPIAFMKVHEQVANLDDILTVEPAALRQSDGLTWVLTNVAVGEKRELKITRRGGDSLAVLEMKSTVEVMNQLISSTNVFVPDVRVSVTLPVKVESGKEFSVEILVSNDSDKTFVDSDLQLKLLQGVHKDGETEIVKTIQVPGPGKTLAIPLRLTSTDAAEAILEAKLHLQKTLTVPVTAHTAVFTPGQSAPTSSPETEGSLKQVISKKSAERLAVIEH